MHLWGIFSQIIFTTSWPSAQSYRLQNINSRDRFLILPSKFFFEGEISTNIITWPIWLQKLSWHSKCIKNTTYIIGIWVATDFPVNKVTNGWIHDMLIHVTPKLTGWSFISICRQVDVRSSGGSVGRSWPSMDYCVGVTCTHRHPRFAGSNPVEVGGFFQEVKILSTSPLGGTLSHGVPRLRCQAR